MTKPRMKRSITAPKMLATTGVMRSAICEIIALSDFPFFYLSFPFGKSAAIVSSAIASLMPRVKNSGRRERKRGFVCTCSANYLRISFATRNEAGKVLMPLFSLFQVAERAFVNSTSMRALHRNSAITIAPRKVMSAYHSSVR